MTSKIIRAPYIDQTEKWPTGCESVSTVMLLQYLGYDISVDDFIKKYLIKDSFEIRRGYLYGPDPYEMFCGSPYDKDSYGCYAPVIVNALNSFFDSIPSCPYCAEDATDMPMGILLETYIENDIPVIFWSSLDCLPTIIGPDWRLKSSGETFTWISNEHCMLLVGYDDENYYFNDPWKNHGTIGYAKSLIEQRHREQHSMAVVITSE
ncbi:MAG: C39 family peptidase [Lachnospiraceae bacterium]|nr:C39 family peptidase [Lachnospiraceae bacterium]